MAKIEVSEDIVKSFELLRTELDTIYAPKKLSNDEIMGAMIGGFFDSLTHLHQHGHDDHKCNCEEKCKDDGKCKC